MTSHASPLSPSRNAVVMASAGTGKTWQLVTRLLRLLLEGAAPDTILAITFTRKAAMEMETRLLQRLYTLADASDEKLVQLLQEAGASVDGQTIQRARRLHEELLRAARPLRTTTFHAFCQELLRRFPLEADVPPGFELLESHSEMAETAWQALLNEVALAPAASLTLQLEKLLELCGSLSSLRNALFGFLDHRGDWWAFIEDEKDGEAFAAARLREQLGVDPNSDPLHDLFDAALDMQLGEYVALMARHPGVENARQLIQLSFARDEAQPYGQRFDALQSALLTKEGNPRSRKPSKAQAKSMGGEIQEARFLELATLLCGRTLTVRQQLAALDSWRFNTLWYQIGSHLLDIFQRIKQEQRLLDFTDLEWRSYRLLANGENAHWIQYKLDQRIDHLLVDEFQDTNPTQWRMLLPLLQEMAAGASERRRSVFLVGDAKQSIYRFRRAEPLLFPAAQAWLTSQMQAGTFPMHSSRRSSPAIMVCVNQLFSLPQLHGILHDFTPHTTHLEDLWGEVVVLPPPVPAQETEVTPSAGMRNPLLQPRAEQDDGGTLQEARQIAGEMRRLVAANTLIGSGSSIRPLHYGDIMLLLRNRTRVRLFEQALREAAIPFIGADRGTLLESMEVRDMIALLQTLLTPFDNLALATVLRSPLGSCSNDDLLALAPDSRGGWWERLTLSQQSTPRLQRMATLLMRWQGSAGQLPIHDLLDRIYCEGNVLERYEAAYPEHLRSRVRANLIRFLELALEMDSGRYPSLNHFLARLEQLRDNQNDAPDEAPSSGGQRVKIMTIHASKGLESPVVFLADTGNSETRDRSTFRPLVRWPVEQPRPDGFLLAGRKAERDLATSRLIEAEKEALQKESVNLLYVAMTRARQILFISGTPSRRTSDTESWYELLRKALDPDGATPEHPAVLEMCTKPVAATTPSPVRKEEDTFHAIPAALTQPLTRVKGQQEIAPSRVGTSGWLAVEEGDEDGRLRGIAIHRFLQLLACRDQGDIPSLLQTVAAELALPPGDRQLREWFAEAQRVVNHAAFHSLFASTEPAQGYCELPLLYRNGQGETVHGIIDRLVVSPKEILLIDYKTHRSANSDTIPTLAESYREQLRHYTEGLSHLWPDKKIRPLLLFTAPLTLHELTLQ